MEGGTTSREGKEQAFAFSVSWGRTVGDYYQTLLHCVSTWRRHCEKLVWCEGNNFFFFWRLIRGMTIRVLPLSYCTLKHLIFLPHYLLLLMLYRHKGSNIFTVLYSVLSLYSISCHVPSSFSHKCSACVCLLCWCTVDVAGGLAEIHRCIMGGSAAPGWSGFSLNSLSRTLAGYF